MVFECRGMNNSKGKGKVGMNFQSSAEGSLIRKANEALKKLNVCLYKNDIVGCKIFTLEDVESSLNKMGGLLAATQPVRNEGL